MYILILISILFLSFALYKIIHNDKDDTVNDTVKNPISTDSKGVCCFYDNPCLEDVVNSECPQDTEFILGGTCDDCANKNLNNNRE